MLVQLHWQNRDDYRQTEFVAQWEGDNHDAYDAWARDVIERRRHEMPEGWCPMVCTEESEYFVRAAPDSIVSIDGQNET